MMAHGSVTRLAARQLQGGPFDRSSRATPSVVAEPLPDAPGTIPAEPLSLSQAAAAAQVPPERTHSGLSALMRSTASDFVAFPKRQSTWVILGIGAGAAAIAYPFDDEINEELQEADGLRKFLAPGKYLGYGWVQGGAAVGLYVVGRYALKPDAGSRTNKVSHLGFDLLRANLVTQAFTYGIKYAVQRDRPTGECCAFPSGHASVTFATAAVLERHFGYRASWPMFAIAGYVSASRLTDNRHFLSDVLFGSALGMATGWTVVGRHGRDNFALYPVPVRGGVLLAGSWTPTGNTRTTGVARHPQSLTVSSGASATPGTGGR
jgi:membrane-associated phospholipid phosphatase